MRKFILTFLVLTVFLSGCSKLANTSNGKPDANSIAAYFVPKSNAYYEYDGAGKPYTDQNIYVSYVKGSRIQRLVNSNELNWTEVLDYSNGELRLIFGGDSYYFSDITDSKDTMNVLILKEPLKVGNKWNLDANYESEITNMSAQVETPSGKYTAMEITSTSKDGMIQKDYYVKNFGLVKTVYLNKDEESTTSLRKVSENSALQLSIKFFIPKLDGQEIDERTISLSTNMDLKGYFQTEMKKASKPEETQLFTQNTKINTIEVDYVNSLLGVDLSKDFINELSVDENTENTILQCIANTFGNFYKVEKVQISIDGGKYESENIVKELGECFIVEN